MNLFSDDAYELSESRQFKSAYSIKNMTKEDVASTMMAYTYALSILEYDNEYAVWVQEYLTNTMKYGRTARKPQPYDTDMYHAYYILQTNDTSRIKDDESLMIFPQNQFLLWGKETILGKQNVTQSRNLYKNMISGLGLTGDHQNITMSISTWDRLNKTQRQILATRVYQLLKKHARKSDIFPTYDKWYKKMKVNPSILANMLTIGALGLVAHNASGIKDRTNSFRDRLRQQLDETSAANIASVATPLMNVRRYLPKYGDRKKKNG